MNQMLLLDAPILEIIEKNFAGLYSGELGLSSIKGGQTAADQAALATLDITGYAARRSEVLTEVQTPGASVLISLHSATICLPLTQVLSRREDGALQGP